jgi:regulator of sirC expression with transglutaminase-like and TPR domain
MTTNEITALVSLLDEQDESILTHVKSKIVSLGDEVLDFLHDVWNSKDTSNVVLDRVEDIIHKIQINTFDAHIRAWVKNENSDLLDGVFIVNSMHYPELDGVGIREELESIKHNMWLELNDKLTAFEKVKILNHFFFEEEGFKPNRADYHSPDNSMINKVIENRKGNPLTLAILYLHIARRLELPVYGINTPNHFLLAWVIEPDTNDPFAEEEDEHPEVLFYINPFSNGAILQKEGIDSFLAQNGVKRDKAFYLPCDELAIIKRMLNNLKNSYEKTGDKARFNDISHLLNLFMTIPATK